MKIALIRKEYVDEHGGAERYAVSLARGLAGLGHSVHVFAGMFQPEQHAGISLHHVPFISSPSPLKNLSFQNNAQKIIAHQSFDIINGLSQVFPQDVYRVGDGLHVHWLRLQAPRPWQRIMYYLNPRHQVILMIERRIFAQGNYRRLIVNSVMCKNQLMYYYGIPEKHIRVIRNGVNLKLFHPDEKNRMRDKVRSRFRLSPTDTVLLFVGHNFQRKGLQYAIQCAYYLNKRGQSVKLLVVGRGNQAYFKRLAERIGIADAVLFLGQQPAIQDFYCASEILIHPALYDPFSNVCLEAMACGLPVLTTRHNGASEIITEGVSGIIVENSWEVEKMISAMLPLLDNNRTGLQAMAIQAARLARDYTVEQNVQQTVGVYEEVLQEKNTLG